MRSSKISLNSKKIKTQFLFSLYAGTLELYHTENPIKNYAYSSRDIAILVMLKTIKYTGNWILLLAKYQYKRVPTRFAWSHHIMYYMKEEKFICKDGFKLKLKLLKSHDRWNLNTLYAQLLYFTTFNFKAWQSSNNKLYLFNVNFSYEDVLTNQVVVV